MKKLLIAVVLSVVLFIAGCVDPFYSSVYSWETMEVYILNYTNEDISVLLTTQGLDTSEAVVAPSGLTLTQADFKKGLDKDSYLADPNFKKTLHMTTSEDTYNIGISKAEKVGDTYIYNGVDSMDGTLGNIQVTQNSEILYESDIYVDNAWNELYTRAGTSDYINIYSVIPFERDTIDEVYIYWVEEDSNNKDMLLKCYIGIFPTE